MYGSEPEALVAPWGSSEDGGMCQATLMVSLSAELTELDPHADANVVTSAAAISITGIRPRNRFTGSAPFPEW